MELAPHLVRRLVVRGDGSSDFARLHPTSPLGRAAQDRVDHCSHDMVCYGHVASRLQVHVDVCLLPHVDGVSRIDLLGSIEAELHGLLRAKGHLLLRKLLLPDLLSHDDVAPLPAIWIKPHYETMHHHLPREASNTGQRRHSNHLLQLAGQFPSRHKVRVLEVHEGVVNPLGNQLDVFPVGVHVWANQENIGICDQQLAHVQRQLLSGLIPYFDILPVEVVL
mmetsp:Transcript_23208/g.54772  ORF Transcript_23208/g.54772 Transcript_23208/m.54772 type:complete len:222 (+) Transcript_23208:123-788(+)